MTCTSVRTARWRGLGAALMSSLFAASSGVATAQGTAQPVRPSTAVFGGAGQAPHDTLVATISAYGAQDDQLSAETGGLNQAGPLNEFYSGADVTLSFVPNQRNRATYDLRGGSSVRYYPSLSDVAAASQSLSAGVVYLATQHSTVHVRGGASYFPYFDYSQPVGLGDTQPGAPQRLLNNQLSTRKVLGYDGAVDYTYAATPRTALTLISAMRRTSLLDEDQTSIDTTLAGTFTRRLSRTSSARAGYVFRNGGFRRGTAENPLVVNDLELGFDKDWTHSPTRRTSLSLSGGPTIVDYQGQRQYRAFGSVSLASPFGRTWSVRGLYRRGITMLDGRSEPFLSSSVSAGVSGLLTRRLDVTLVTGAVLGDIGLEGGVGTAYDTYTGSVRVRYGLNRTLALYAEYLHSYSTFAESGPVAGLNRRGFRGGLTIYAPLVRSAGSAAPDRTP